MKGRIIFSFCALFLALLCNITKGAEYPVYTIEVPAVTDNGTLTNQPVSFGSLTNGWVGEGTGRINILSALKFIGSGMPTNGNYRFGRFGLTKPRGKLLGDIGIDITYMDRKDQGGYWLAIVELDITELKKPEGAKYSEQELLTEVINCVQLSLLNAHDRKTQINIVNTKANVKQEFQALDDHQILDNEQMLLGEWEDVKTIAPRLKHQRIIIADGGKCILQLYEYFYVMQWGSWKSDGEKVTIAPDSLATPFELRLEKKGKDIFLIWRGHRFRKLENPNQTQHDPPLDALVGQIRKRHHAQNTYSPLYILLMKEDGVNRHSPDEVLPIVNTMLRWSFRKGRIQGITNSSPLPESRINAYSNRTILISFDESGSGSGTNKIAVAECYEISSDKFRKPTPEEVTAARTKAVSDLSKRGYSIARVHHRIRGRIAFVNLGLGALDLRMVFEKQGQKWRLLHPYTVFWGVRVR